MSGAGFPHDGHPLAKLFEKLRQVWEDMLRQSISEKACDEAFALIMQLVEDNDPGNDDHYRRCRPPPSDDDDEEDEEDEEGDADM